MRNSGSRTYLRQTPIPKMPPGLIDLMEGMAKEVLKKNPTDIYDFCAAHMRRLLEIRDGLAQEQSMPLKIKQPTIQNQQEVDPEKCSGTNEKKIILNGNYDLKENLIAKEDFKTSIEANLPQNFVKVPVRHEMDLMEASEIEIAQEFINPENTGKCTPAEIFENDNVITADENYTKIGNVEKQYAELANNFEIEERNPTHFNETDNVNSTSLVESKSNTDKETEIFEVNQSNMTNDYVTTMVEENIQTSVTNEIDISQGQEINTTEIVQEERNKDIADAENCTKSPTLPNIVEDTLKITPDEHISHNAKELNSIIEHDNDITSIDEAQKGEQNLIDEVQKGEQNPIDEAQKGEQNPIDEGQKGEKKQIPPTLDDTSKEEKSCEVKVTSEENEFKHDDNCLIENENYVQSKIREEVNDFIFHDVNSTETEVTLNADEHKISFVENVTDIDNNKHNNGNGYSTNENDDTSISNNVKDFEELNIENNTEDTFSENENSNNLQVRPDNKSDKDLLATPQNIKEVDTDKQTLQMENDITPTYINETSPNYDDLETKISIDNSGNTCRNDNDSNNMDLETAAITIQKVFRSFLYKSRGSTFEDVTNDENVSSDKEIEIYPSQNIERRPLGITRIDSVLQTVNEEKSLSLSTDDSSTLSSAATIIQAHVRGFLLRNKINASKTISTNSLISSDSHPVTSSDDGDRHQKNKTVLNIHIVPEAENKSFSRDETVINSVDLSLDCSPPTSINLHPLGYDKSEPRKQLKREDAFQSVSPPSTNSGKLSEDIDSAKEIVTNDNVPEKSLVGDVLTIEVDHIKHVASESNDSLVGLASKTIEEDHIKHVALESNNSLVVLTSNNEQQKDTEKAKNCLTKMSSDELDVVTPFVEQKSDQNVSNVETSPKLVHSGEFHDVVVPTKVTRSDTSVVRGE